MPTEDNDAEPTEMIRSKQLCQIVAESADAVLEVLSAVTVNESVLTSPEAVTVDDGISDTVDCTFRDPESNDEYSEEQGSTSLKMESFKLDLRSSTRAFP